MRKTLTTIVVVLFISLLIIRLSIPYGARYAVSDWFASQGVVASIDEFNLELFAGELVIDGFNAQRDDGAQHSIGSLRIHWSWSALFNNRAVIERVSLEGLSITVQERDGRLLVVGLVQGDSSDSTDDIQASSEPADWKIALDELTLDDINVCAQLASSGIDHCFELDSLVWRGSTEIDLARLDETYLPLQLSSEVTIEGLSITDAGLQRQLIGFDRLMVEGIDVDTLEQVDISKLQLDALHIMERSEKASAPHITSIGSIKLEPVSIRSLSALTIGTFEIDDHSVYASVDRDGEMEFTEWLPSSTDDGDTSEEAPPSASSVRIERFSYVTDRPIRFSDNSMSQPFSVAINQMELVVEDIDSTDPTNESTISLASVYEDHGKLALAGTAILFSDNRSFTMDGNIDGIDLKNISPITLDTVGHIIKSGQLDADLNLKAVDDQLDSSIDLALHRFELKAKSKNDAGRLDDTLGFPFNTSLALLKDKNDTISLSIPITGDLDNPDFDPGDAINTALSKAVTFAIINYYTPFGLVTLADGVLDLSSGLGFDPVVFEPQESALPADAPEKLAPMIDLLNERPGVKITLCGFSNYGDLMTPVTPDPEGKKKLTREQIDSLEGLATKRAENTKVALIDMGVDAPRLITCSPEFSEAGFAGVEIAI